MRLSRPLASLIALLILVLVSCAAPTPVGGTQSAPAASGQRLLATPTRLASVSDQDRYTGWKGERVILLGSRPDDKSMLIAGDSVSGGKRAFYLRDRPNQGLPRAEYAGRIGTITDVVAGKDRTDLIITLDGTGEVVVGNASSHDYLGFLGEMEVAKGLVAKALWTKAPRTLAKNCDLALTRSQLESEKISVGSIQRLVVTRAEWGDSANEIYLYLKTDEGLEGCLQSSAPLAAKYHTTSDLGTGSRALFIDSFWSENPRALFAAWSEDTWKLITEGEVAIGMTSDMAQLACGGEPRKIGALLSEVGVASPIYRCADKSFVVTNGIVVRYY